MQYLIPIIVTLALLGCESNPGGSQDGVRSDSNDATDYLEKSLTGRVVKHGLFKLVRSGGVVDDPNTNTGKVIAKPVLAQVESTERIPLIKGAQMYLQYRIKPFPDNIAWVDFSQVLKHPEMTLPDGSVSTGAEIPFKGKVSSNQAIGYIGYGFDEDYELVEGDWEFEVWYQNKKLVEQKFTTYWPDKDKTAALQARLASLKRNAGHVRTSSLPEDDWPVEVEINIGDNPILKDVVPIVEPSKESPGPTD